MSGVTGPAPRTPGARGAGARRRTGGSLRAVVRALALSGLLLAGVALLLVALAPLVLAGLGLGQFFKYQLNHGLDMNSQWGRDLLGVVLGVTGCWFLVPVALLGLRRLAMLTRRLSAAWCGVAIGQAYAPAPAGTRRGQLTGRRRMGYQQRMSWLLSDTSTWRDLLWQVVNIVVGWVLLLGPVAIAGVGVVTFLVPALGSIGLFSALRGLSTPPVFPGNTPVVLFVIGVALTALGLAAGPVALRGYGGLARLVLAPSGEAQLALRVAQLTQTRRETLDTGAAELRRIERDLHDGAQARLVAMGLTLDAAGRLIDTDPAAARALLYEARDASARALAELRDLVRGIHPPVLADRGLADAVRALALDSPLRVRVTGALSGSPGGPGERPDRPDRPDRPARLPAPVESAAYFAVSELLANVAKHSGAGAAEVDLWHADGSLRVRVSDDGAGGADAARGTGISGIARRLGAFDGVLVVSSPVGGPTVVTLEIPCALS
jgi:signal transduction histidine kinase